MAAFFIAGRLFASLVEQFQEILEVAVLLTAGSENKAATMIVHVLYLEQDVGGRSR